MDIKLDVNTIAKLTEQCIKEQTQKATTASLTILEIDWIAA